MAVTERPLFIRLNLPDGLEEALEGLAREVLREKPGNIYEFAADYFEDLVKKRNKDAGLPTDDIFGLHQELNLPKECEVEEDAEIESLSGLGTEENGDATSNHHPKEEGKRSIEVKMPAQPSLSEEEPEEIDIDLNDPDVEKAATKIQAGYKGMKSRQETRTLRKEKAQEQFSTEEHHPTEEAENDDPDHAKDQDIKDNEVDIDLEDPDVQDAAVKIQAGYKGMKTRKDLKTNGVKDDDKEDTNNLKLGSEPQEPVSTNDEVVDIDLDDPEVQKATEKIQAGYKGMKTRKSLKKTDDSQVSVAEAGATNDQENLVEVNEAAVTALDTKNVPGEDTKNESNTTENTADGKIGLSHEDEAIDIDLEDPEVENAAVKIQAGFKGMKTRKEMRESAKNEQETTKDVDEKDGQTPGDVIDIDLDDPEVQDAAVKIQAGFKGMKTRKDLQQAKTDEAESLAEPQDNSEIPQDQATVNEEIDIDLEDPEVQKATEKIQAGYKGMKTRRELKQEVPKSETEGDENIQSDEVKQTDVEEARESKEEIVDIDLMDPEVQDAAVKIQAGYKGMKTRKEIKDRKKPEDDSFIEEKAVEEIDIDLTDPDVENAAIKIQAGYKGMQVRKGMKAEDEGNSGKASEGELNNKKDDVKVEESEEVDIDLNDPDVQDAAVKIQAGYKGMKVRKERKHQDDQIDAPTEPNEELTKSIDRGQMKGEDENPTEDIDIDLEDPDVQKATVKIQAGYKGMKTRRDLKAGTENNIEISDAGATPTTETQEEIDIDLNDTDVQDAAVKIQAGFRGMQTRKEMRDKSKPAMETIDETEHTKDNATCESQEVKNKEEEEEVVDIDLEDPEVQDAAVKIQAGYKGMKTRKTLKKETEESAAAPNSNTNENSNEDGQDKLPDDEGKVDIDLDDPDVQDAAVKIQAGFKGMKTRKEMKADAAAKEQSSRIEEKNTTEEKQVPDPSNVEEIDIDLEDPEVQDAAAKIQAGYKGMRVRKELKAGKDEEPESSEVQKADEGPAEDEVDIDLEDPEVQDAAAKIQAGYKGMRVRKELKAGNEGEQQSINVQESDKVNIEDEVDIDLEDPDVQDAAVKIQAGYKGMKTRKELKDKAEDGTTNANVSEQEKPVCETSASPHLESDKQDKEIDIDLEDPEVQKATEKIQAGYKGMRTRRDLKQANEGDIKAEEQDCDDHPKKASESDKTDEKAEEVDINLDDPEVQDAAVKIQAGYKGMKTRKELKGKSPDKEQQEATKGDEGETEEANVDIDLNDPEVADAAVKIQAGYKGMKVRKEMKDGATKPDEPQCNVQKTDQQAEKDLPGEQQDAVGDTNCDQQDEEVDIDLEDPEVQKATEKIQAGYKGMRTRRDLKEKKVAEDSVQVTDKPDEQVEIDIDLEDPEVAEAATKIQAGYKGMKARKEVNEIKQANKKDVESGIVMTTDTETEKEEEEEEQAVDEAQATEMLIAQQGDVSNADEPDQGRSLGVPDDGYISPENPTWVSSTQAGLSAPSSAVSSPTKQCDSAALVDSSSKAAGGQSQSNYQSFDKTEDDLVLETDQVEESEHNSLLLEVDAKTLLQAPFEPDAASNLSFLSGDDESITVIDEIKKDVHDTTNRRPDQEAPLDQEAEEVNAQANELTTTEPLPNEEPILSEEVQESLGAVPFVDKDEGEEDEGKKEEVGDKIVTSVGLITDTGLVAMSVEEMEAIVAAANSDEAHFRGENPQLTLYYDPKSFACQKVLVYMLERAIDFKHEVIDLSDNEHLAKWFLAINPKGEVPTLTMASRDDQEKKTLTDSNHIIHVLEGMFRQKPLLAPSLSNPEIHKDYVQLMTLLEQIPMTDIIQGLSFHTQFVQPLPETPYSLDVFSRMQRALLDRAEVLSDAAETAGTVISDECATALRQKAKEHMDKLQVLQNMLRFAELLEGVQKTLDLIDVKLGEVMLHNSEDECERWLLESINSDSMGFSAADVVLGVILNKLSLLGIGYMFWTGEKRKFVRKFYSQIKQRAAFVQGVKHVGLLDPPSLDMSRSVDGSGGAAVGNLPSEQSIEVLNVLLRAPPYYRNLDERTWHDLW